MVETYADLKEQFQKQREKEEQLFCKVFNLSGTFYRVDNPEEFYLKNIREITKKRGLG